MELEKQIQADMVAAMKAKETVRLASLRAIKAAILLAKTAEGGTGEVSDQDREAYPETGEAAQGERTAV